MSVLHQLAAHLFEFEREETRGELLFFKLFEATVAGMLIYQVWSWGAYIPRISDVVMPLGLANYFDITFMFESSLPLLNAGAITMLLLAGFLRLSRWAYLAAFALILFQYAARYSLGEIPHGTNLTAMVLLGLAMSALAFEGARERRRFTMGFTYFFVGLAYTLAAWSKLIGTGLHWIDGRHLWLWLNEKAIDTLALEGTHSFNVLQEVAFTDHRIATAFLLGGLVVEFFAFLLWLKPTRRLAGMALLGLHAGIFFMMHIDFWMNVVLLLLLAFPWARWLERSFLRTPAGERLARLSARIV